MSRGRRLNAALLVACLVLVLSVPVAAHNVTFRANVAISGDGAAAEVYIVDPLQNPVPDAVVSIITPRGTTRLPQLEPGLYGGTLAAPLATGEAFTLEAVLGQNSWDGEAAAAANGTVTVTLTHVQDRLSSRHFSQLMTAVFGALLACIAVWEAVRWRRRRAGAPAVRG